jgi:hypothetical protein
MKIHFNYAHGRYLQSQQHCCKTALSVGGFDVSIPYGLKDLDPEFVSRNQYTLSQSRGAGYWIWKPYLIRKTIESMGENDWLMYTDSGMYFVRNPWEWIEPIADAIGEKGVLTFGMAWSNKQFCKRDAFVLMGMDELQYTEGKHRLASVFVCRKTPFSLAFVNEWLDWAQDPRILTDLPNTQGLPNYPEFSDHRHDQSIMSLLSIKHQTYVYADKDITQYSNPEDYCIFHTRNPT